MVIDQNEILDVYEKILEEHNRKGDRSDTVICWVLTALAKLTIRFTNVVDKVKELIE